MRYEHTVWTKPGRNEVSLVLNGNKHLVCQFVCPAKNYWNQHIDRVKQLLNPIITSMSPQNKLCVPDRNKKWFHFRLFPIKQRCHMVFNMVTWIWRIENRYTWTLSITLWGILVGNSIATDSVGGEHWVTAWYQFNFMVHLSLAMLMHKKKHLTWITEVTMLLIGEIVTACIPCM